MKRILQSSWMVALIGAVLFLGCTSAFLPSRGYWVSPLSLAADKASVIGPSWEFRNPDLDKMLEDVKQQRAQLDQREKELQEMETRLSAERTELITVTQTVARLQKVYDDNVVRFKEAEVTNLKWLAKSHAAMSPDGSANILKELSDDEITRILVLMKADQAGHILESLGRAGKDEARRAAALSDRLRRSLPPEGP
jgi:flagellar motility protein MotE (MotC chaperone)